MKKPKQLSWMYDECWECNKKELGYRSGIIVNMLCLDEKCKVREKWTK